MKKAYLAVLDSGGISYGGPEFHGFGRTEEEAKEKATKEYIRGFDEVPKRFVDFSAEDVTADRLNDFYGFRIYEGYL